MVELWDIVMSQNPWWREKRVEFSEALWPKRVLYGNLRSYLDEPMILAIIGLRRTGKTTILRQIIADLLDKGVKKERVFYFSFDEAMVARKTEVLEEILGKYFFSVLGQELWQIKEKVYLFIDEVQYIPFWQAIIKRYYDQNKNLKFIISGSSSLFLREEARESLAGRIFEFHLNPLSFREFLEFKRKSFYIPKIEISYESEIDLSLPSFSMEILSLFDEYLSEGQFPELLEFKTFFKKKMYLKDWVIGRVLERDVPSILRLQFPEDLKSLAHILLEGSGRLVEFTNLASELGVSRMTVAHYTSYLEKALILNQVLNHSGTFRQRNRRQRKVYAASTNFLTAIWGSNFEGREFQQNIGRIVETFVYNELKERFDEVYFWREREKEVDFIVKKGKNLIPIEVKFQKKITPFDLKNIFHLIQKRNYKRGFILTYNNISRVLKDKKEVFSIPVWMI
jgi:hypothetical protein